MAASLDIFCFLESNADGVYDRYVAGVEERGVDLGLGDAVSRSARSSGARGLSRDSIFIISLVVISSGDGKY